MQNIETIAPSDIYAIHYLDNGGTVKEFSMRHVKLKKSIEQESKRRLKVSIRYKMMNDMNFKKKIYTKLKISTTEDLKPEELYIRLDKMSRNQLLSVLHP